MSSYKRDNSYMSQIGGNNKGFFSKVLRNVSNWGMDTDEFIRNSHTIGIGEIATPVGTDVDNMYDVISQNAVARLFETKASAYLDKSYKDKVRILREYSRKDEIRDFIEKISNEAIMYDDDSDFCVPSNLPDEFSDEVKKKYLENFQNIYESFRFNDGIVAWSYFKKMIVDGFLAFEIIFDDKDKNIIGFKRLEPDTLLPGVDPSTGQSIWIQYPENPTLTRPILDSQLIYISYSTGEELTETSYVENLIRPYNQLKLLEQTRIMFNLMNAMVHKKITVPIKGMPRNQAEQQLSQLIADYKEEVTFDDMFGTVQINGDSHIPYSKDYWFPEGDSGTPNVEILNQEGHNLNENDMLTWFFNALKRASKIPFTRFDKSNGGGNMFGDANEVSRDELDFFYFIQRLRTIFKEIIVKPWKIQMLIDFPELADDKKFLNAINIKFNGSNLFHEWKKMANMSKRADMVGSLSSSILDKDGEAYFSIDYLVREFMEMDEERLKENERWKKKSGAGSGTGDGSDGGSSDDSFSDDSFSDDSFSDDGGGDLGDDSGGDDLDF